MNDVHIWTLEEVKAHPGFEFRTDTEQFTAHGYHVLQLRPAGLITGLRFSHPSSALDLRPYVRFLHGRSHQYCDAELTDGLTWDFSENIMKWINTAEVIYLRLEFFGVSGEITVEVDRIILRAVPV